MSPKEVVTAFVEAHNEHALDKMMTYLTEDSEMIDVASPIALESKKDVRRLFEMIFGSLDVHFEITGMISEGDRVFAALRTTGLGTGEFMGRDLRGAKFDVFEGMFVEVSGHQIKKTMFYSDTATLSKQLGGYSPAIDMDAGVEAVL
ncbi:MAG: nuclear transport factor 2 family protein [Sphingomonadaceae bacterium]